ncbi:MAG: DNA polymerase III subunit gamma/tau [Planctomycetota bacterium]|jgi:DNA polymerase-3 subunit gamma/tau
MSYRVLARTYRSNTFDEVVGQDAISTTLKNAIETGRVHHGYLFTGTRGVGKTSMARILAKALNCLNVDAPTTMPCCTCDSCVNVASGDDVDVVEIDAASNTGVDNIRDLRSNAAFRPVRSRYKVYIIDEVHMLSAGAFNALLKTLEEPPEHVKFILATTEPQKVPATIKSRCQNFDFRAISADDVAKHLAAILETEGIQADEQVIRRVARLANGSMRDGLSLLDKLLSFESKHLTTAVAETVIPPSHDDQAAAVMAAVAASDPGAALHALDEALQTGRTVERFCGHLIDHVRTLMLLRVCGDDTDLVDVPSQVRAELVRQSAVFDAPTYVYMISLLEELHLRAKGGNLGRALADAAIVRLAMAGNFSDVGDLIERIESPVESLPASAAGGSEQAPAKKKALQVGLGGSEVADNRDREWPDQVTTTAGGAGPASVTNLDPVTGATDAAAHEKAQHEKAQQEKAQQEKVPQEQARNVGQPDDQGAGVDSASKKAAASTGTPATVSSDEWQRVARDPLVSRVRDAVDGTLFDIRLSSKSKPGPQATDENGITGLPESDDNHEET